jgi:HlyD family secretion protein
VLARVEPDVNQARDLSQVKNAVSEAEIALNEAKAPYERNKDLLSQGLLSAQTGLESETRWRQAKANHDAAMDKYRIVQESGVPIASVAEGTIQRLNVTSPMDGVVIRRPVELGDTVMSGVSSFNAGTVLMTVADVNTMIIQAGINEVDIGKVHLDQPVKVTLDAYPKVKFAGKILRIAPAARLEEKVKVFDVEIAIDRQGAELRTGMTANIDIVGEKREKVLTVPVEAIFKKDETEVVYVRKPEEPKKAAEKGGFLSSVFAAGKKDAPAAKRGAAPPEKSVTVKSLATRAGHAKGRVREVRLLGSLARPVMVDDDGRLQIGGEAVVPGPGLGIHQAIDIEVLQM